MATKRSPAHQRGRTIEPTGLPRVLPQVQSLIEAAREHVLSTANLARVRLYWNLGRVIAEDIQQNVKRAGYGEQLIKNLGIALVEQYGQGYSARNLHDMRRFFEEFEILQALPAKFTDSTIHSAPPGNSTSTRILQPVAAISSMRGILQPVAAKLSTREIPRTLPVQSADQRVLRHTAPEPEKRTVIDFTRHAHLGWTHYRILLGVEAGLKRGFYFDQAAKQRWSKRELQHQIDRALFERVALSRDTRALVRLEKQRDPVETVRYEDAFKDPYLLDFLGLKGAYSEKDLESAIIADLQQFLTELGNDFCFIRRQFPMRIDDDDYSLDLLFYHRGLHCLVAIDLKIGPFTAGDKGQMDLYLSWLKKNEWRQDAENEPVGLILCTSKKRQHVELLLSHGPHTMRVSEYLIGLPDKKVLEERLRMYGRVLEQEEGKA